VKRAATMQRDAPDQIILAVDPKDKDIREGGLVDLTTSYLPGVDGYPVQNRVLITKRLDKGSRIELTALTTNFGKRYGFIAPNGYPNYNLASETQRAYAYISNSSGKMSDGTEGYLII
jgi:hypothetical protein